MTERKCAARASARENDGEAAAAAAETADHKTYDEGDGQEEGERGGGETEQVIKHTQNEATQRNEAASKRA